MYLLGYDIGSSSVKATLLDAQTGETLASSYAPDKEMVIIARNSGWAEQDPHLWWESLKKASRQTIKSSGIDVRKIKAIGVSYQMHGLILVDKNKKLLRNSIIWCDSRAVETGNKAYKDLGRLYCFKHLMNSPGNFTASKINWVKNNEPEIFSKIHKIMLPGDYIAMRLTGEISTTKEGLSEGIMWDFKNETVAQRLLDYYQIPNDFLPDISPTFSFQGELSYEVARDLGLYKGIPVTYRAGDQPNNAFSLNVLNPGEVATTAGTSGVIYGISKEKKYEEKSRINTFLHVNHTKENPRYGVLLCINGTSITYSWLKHKLLTLTGNNIHYSQMDEIAQRSPIGSEGLIIFPFGNGAERILENRNVGAKILNLQFNIHDASHIFRATQEGIVFSLKYGLDIMKKAGVKPEKIKAGHSNMFLSSLFCNAFAATTGAVLELYNTNGAAGAARGAGVGAGLYKNFREAYVGLKAVKTVYPDTKVAAKYSRAYTVWLERLEKTLKSGKLLKLITL